MDTTPLLSSTLPRLAKPPRIEGLDVLQMVGQGGQAAVYRSYQQNNDRIVALRIIRTPLLDDAVLRRFDRERRALGRISGHPGIVSMLEAGVTDDGRPYLVLEYATGGTLADRLADGPLGTDLGTALGVVLAGAVEMAHRSGVVHGDIKPQNVLRSTFGEWQLGDFGVATLIGADTTSSAPVSFAHTAPESFDQAGPTASADVYSLASTLYTALTGTEPFAVQEGEMRAAAIRRIVMDPAPDLRRFGVPTEVAEIIVRAMAKDPADRPASSAALGAALNAARQQLGLEITDLRIGTVDDFDSENSEPSVGMSRPSSLVRDRSATRHVGGPTGPPNLPRHRQSGSRPRRPGRRWRVSTALVAGFVTIGVGAAATSADLADVGDAPADILSVVTADGPREDGGDGRGGEGNRDPGRGGRQNN